MTTPQSIQYCASCKKYTHHRKTKKSDGHFLWKCAHCLRVNDGKRYL